MGALGHVLGVGGKGGGLETRRTRTRSVECMEVLATGTRALDSPPPKIKVSLRNFTQEENGGH